MKQIQKNIPDQMQMFKTFQLKPFLTCKDYTVSGKLFEVRYDPDYDMGITFPQPDATELPKYYQAESYISHTDAARSLFEKVYQIVKRYTIRKKIRLIRSLHRSGKTLLDIGCGTGDFIAAAAKAGWEVTGVEPSETARKNAGKKLPVNVVLHKKIDSLTGSEKQFDVITMWHVLEHVPNLTEYIGFLKKLLKPEGVLLVAVPNFKSYDAAYYGKYWAAYDVPRHLWHFSKKAIQMMFHPQKLEVTEIRPMKFDAFYVSLLSEKHKNGKGNPLKAFWVGVHSNLKASIQKEYSSLIYIIRHTKN